MDRTRGCLCLLQIYTVSLRFFSSVARVALSEQGTGQIISLDVDF